MEIAKSLYPAEFIDEEYGDLFQNAPFVKDVEGIVREYCGFEFTVSDDSIPEEETYVIGVLKDRTLNGVHCVGVVEVPEITEEDNRLLDEFLEKNPAFKGQKRGLFVVVEDGR